MRSLIRFSAKLYPPRWRSRYGAEFDALLEDERPSARAAIDVLTGALLMQIRTTWKVLAAALVVAALIGIVARHAGRHPYISPGTNLVLHDASGLGAIVGFFAVVGTVFLFLAACVARRMLLASFAPLAGYSLLVIATSLMTPRTIVSIGDSYCYDEVCVGVQKVDGVPEGPSVVYKTQVRIFTDPLGTKHSLKGASAAVYLLDERGRRFRLEDGLPEDTLEPGQSVDARLTFTAAADSHELYLTADQGAVPPWVYLYFGSDTSLFHRRTLLKVL
jgi:hypothetical protein